MAAALDGEKDPESPDGAAPARPNDGHGFGRPSTASPLWASESLSLPREAAFVFMTCMAQFCTRASSRARRRRRSSLTRRPQKPPS